jgi:hypothetical protein
VGGRDLSGHEELGELAATAARSMNRQVAHVDIEAVLRMHLHTQFIRHAFSDAL